MVRYYPSLYMIMPDYRLKSLLRNRRLTNTISRCIICGQFFDSKKELREHKDKSHRITNAKLAQKSHTHGENNIVDDNGKW